MARHLKFAHSDKRRRPYWRDERLLGRTFMQRQQEGVLVIGSDVWTRQQMVEELKCGNFAAAANLTKIANKLQVDNLKQLAARFSIEDLFQEDRFGITTMFVLMCALEAEKRDPLTWVDHKPDEIVTLTTEKARAMKSFEDAKKERLRKARAATHAQSA